MIIIKNFDQELFLHLCKRYGVKLDKTIKEPIIVLDNKTEKKLSELSKSEIKKIIVGK